MLVEQLKTLGGRTVDGPLLLTPTLFKDERGYFYESWNKKELTKVFNSYGQFSQEFVQDNHSRSVCGVLRGLHYQVCPNPQSKLVRCIVGEIFDVAVDIRKNSDTFGDWVSAKLTSTNHHQLWIPEGFAHGFLTISQYAEVNYKTTSYWDAKSERSIRWNDPNLKIIWPSIENIPKPIVSAKDMNAPFLEV